MGDVVLQTATVNWLRSLFGPALRLTFVTSSEFSSLLDSHPGINKVLTFNRRGDESWNQFIKKMKHSNEENPFDLILDLHGTLRSFRLKMSFWTTPALSIDKRRWERFALTKLKGVFLKQLIKTKLFGLENQVERIINDLESLFQDSRGVRRTKDSVQGAHDEMTSLSSLPDYSMNGPYLVLAPSASFAPKRWPIQHFVELAKKLLENTSFKIVILAGPEDKFCDAFGSIESDRMFNLQGKTTLKESMSILSRALLCVGNDSGMNHIAEAYGVPCLTIFGPTDPRFGFAPHGSSSKYLSKELWCKPCSTTGSRPCSRERLFCMEEISVNEVFTTIQEMGVKP
jgi:ADP-heptose:LPS heptosyltransferase